jgi:ABC-2 type transport system ATP-binding protein
VLDGAVVEVKAAAGNRTIALALAGALTPEVSEVLGDRSLVQRMDDNNRYFEIELSADADAQALLHRLIGAGASIERFERVNPSLHQIFLEKVGAKGVEEGMSGHG